MASFDLLLFIYYHEDKKLTRFRYMVFVYCEVNTMESIIILPLIIPRLILVDFLILGVEFV